MGCGQGEQPVRREVGVGPALMVGAASTAPTMGTFVQDAPQAHPDPPVKRVELGLLGVLEVLEPAPQYRVDPRNDGLQAESVGAAGE